MNNMQKKVLDTCIGIAKVLDDSYLNRIINGGISFPSEEKKLNLVMIGQLHHELFEMAHKLLDADQAVTGRATRADKSYQVNFTYGETFSCGVVNIQGEYITVPIAELDEIICGMESDFTGGFIELNITVNSLTLKNMDVTLVCSSNNYEDCDWHPVFSGADFCVVLLSAISLLSLGEKTFIKNKVYPVLGRERLGICVSDYGALTDVDKKDVEEALQYFFKSDDVIVPIFYSANGTRGLYPEFYEFVNNELAARLEVFRKSLIKQNLLVCVNETMAAALRMKDALEPDTDKLDAAIRQLNAAMGSVEHKRKSTGRRIEMYINANVKIIFTEKITAFNELLKNDIRKSLMENSNFEKMKKSLPRYIERTWKEFFKTQQLGVSGQIRQEMLGISSGIQKEIVDALTSELDSESGDLLAGCLFGELRGNLPETRFKSDHWAAEISKYMSIGGIVLLFANIPLALLTVSGSQALKHIFKDDIESSKRNKFIDSTLTQCDDIARRIINQTDEQFSVIIHDLKNNADNAYQKAFDDMLDTLNERKSAAQNAGDRLAYVNEALENAIPRLRGKLAEV